MNSNKSNVLLVLEGTYPFAGGGVSTWAHMLCSKVTNANFILYSINAEKEDTYEYPLPSSVKQVIQVPIWGAEEPSECVAIANSYIEIIDKKERTSNRAIKKKFLPLFKQFLQAINEPQTETAFFEEVIHGMWSYFSNYDYKETMRSELVWETYKKELMCIHHNELEAISLYDLTVGMRWIYRFLMPLSIEIPPVNIAHITLAGFPILPALIAKYQYNCPIVISEHGVFIRERLLAINGADYSFFLKKMLIQFSERITQLAYYKADKILSVNKFNMKWEQLYGAPYNKIEVIYNGVDHQLFKPRKKPNHLQEIPTVVAAARIFDLKDIETMIRSCAVVKKSIPTIRYIVYGNKNAVPEYTNKCNQLIEKLDLTANFILAGHHSKPHLIYAEGDVSILTSISEGFPYTVLEAMSSGLPVVATDVGGVYEAIDASCGFLCKPKDYLSIAKRVEQLLLDKPLRKEMAKNARQKVIENFTISKFITQYEAVYSKLSKNKARVQNLYNTEVKEAS